MIYILSIYINCIYIYIYVGWDVRYWFYNTISKYTNK